MFKLPKEVVSGIEDYKIALNDFVNNRMDKNRFKGIRVPWGIYNQRGGRVFMSRIRVPGGTIAGGQLKALAEASKRYGSGILHITTRQDIQIHRIRVEDTAAVMDFLKGYELCPRGGGGNTVRNIMACPLAGICPLEVFDVRPYAVGLTEYMLRDPKSYMMPRKYKISFSGCGADCGMCTVNDIGFTAKEGGFKVYAGGGMGAVSMTGSVLEEFIPKEDAGYTAEAVKRVFFKYGERKDRNHARLRFLVKRMGFAEFKRIYKEELAAVKKTEHISLRNVEFKYPALCGGSSCPEEDLRGKYNVFEQKQKGYYAVEADLPLGDIPADKLISVAELGDFDYRTNRRQNIYIANIKGSDLPRVCREVERLGLGPVRASGTVDITCCAGASTCNLGLCNSRGLAQEIYRILSGAETDREKTKKTDIKISGCPNACGHHPIASLGMHGVVRRAGGRSAPFYKILIGGSVSEENARLAGEKGVVPARSVPLVVKEYLAGSAGMDELIKKYSYIPSYEEDPLFYRDWGKDEDFSLEGIGPGECGSGVIDMIESDLKSAEVSLSEGNLGNALYYSARALLVTRGIEPRTREETIDAFVKEFVDTGIADDKYKDLSGLKNNDFAEGFYNEVKKIYDSMDSSFNFPKKKQAEKKHNAEKVLDLRGVACPINYVKTKLYLENVDIDTVVEVYLDGGEPVRNVPASLKEDGQEIISLTQRGEFYSLVVRKKV